MLNDDEIVTSVQEESDPVDDETDEDEDNNESSKDPSNSDVFSALDSHGVVRTTIRVLFYSTTAAQENQIHCSQKRVICYLTSYEQWCKEAEKKNRNSNILIGQKTFSSKVVLQQMLEITARSRLGIPNSDAAWISLLSRRFLACHVSSRQLQILERFLQLKEQVSCKPNSLSEPRRSPCTFEHLL
ncbi:hypothetical protein TNCV_556771 [Trichonephila clavipes]|uniref:Uncharacterized protein n=1 Tax=Trichonephila clavipes TaxID=2585209 RepID=A0A8X6V6X9_TRICX|nr:hypothetical protein TNCV_556771 [Trichonephila clavipes]